MGVLALLDLHSANNQIAHLLPPVQRNDIRERIGPGGNALVTSWFAPVWIIYQLAHVRLLASDQHEFAHAYAQLALIYYSMDAH